MTSNSTERFEAGSLQLSSATRTSVVCMLQMPQHYTNVQSVSVLFMIKPFACATACTAAQVM
jgi:hypothetical protein